MRVRIKVITPVHIGSGQPISPSGYFIDREKGNFNVLNMDSLFRDPAFTRYREQFINEAGRARYIGDIIQDHNLLKKHILYSIPITQEARRNRIEVKGFIKSAGRPYIPGSSIKGAMISALIYYALKELYTKHGKEKDIRELLISNDKNDRRANDTLLSLAYGFLAGKGRSSKSQSNPAIIEDEHSRDRKEDKFLNLFDVSDSTCLSAKNSLKVERCEVEGAKRGGQIPVLYETIKEGVEAEFEIKSKKDCILKEDDILKVCHEFYKKVAQKDNIKFSLKDGLDNQIEPYLLRIGQGATVFSTSLLILAEELGIQKYPVRQPQTRKRLIDNSDKKRLGFVQLSMV